MNYEEFSEAYKAARTDCISLARSLKLPKINPSVSDSPKASMTFLMLPIVFGMVLPILKAKVIAQFIEGLKEKDILEPNETAYEKAQEQGLSGRQYFFFVRPNRTEGPVTDKLAMESKNYNEAMTAIASTPDDAKELFNNNPQMNTMMDSFKDTIDLNMFGDAFLQAMTGLYARFLHGVHAMDEGKSLEQATEVANAFNIPLTVEPDRPVELSAQTQSNDSGPISGIS